MFRSKRKKVKDSPTANIEPQRRTLREIIDGKLYDTSKAKEMTVVNLNCDDIPNYAFMVNPFKWHEVIIYRGNTEWFIVYGDAVLEPVTEEWVKDTLGKYNADKYIELFGEPELA